MGFDHPGTFAPAQDRNWCVGKTAVGRPASSWSDRELGQGEEHGIVVDAPARKIAPGLFAIGFERHTGGSQFFESILELRS